MKEDYMSPKTQKVILADDTVVKGQEPVIKTATIANGASLSGAVDVRGYRIAGIVTPANWTEAVMTFQNAPAADGTFANVQTDAAAEVTTGSLVASTYYAVSALAMALTGLQFVKVRSGPAAAAVNQAGGDIVSLVLVAL